MSEIIVSQVRTGTDKSVFLNFPWHIFQGDPLWVPPLLPDLRDRINPEKGIFFQRGEAEFFIAWRDGKPVGTICAAEDMRMNTDLKKKECVFGFFNYIEDYKVFVALLAQAEKWAASRGLNEIVGPFNLDYEDGYGVLIEGWDRPPVLMCGHSPRYYAVFMEKYGFESSRGDNIAIGFDLVNRPAEFADLHRVAERVRARKNYIVRPGDLSRWEEEIERIYILLNTALAHLPDFRPWPREVVFNMLAPFRKIVDPRLILFAEHDGKTVGWLPGIPNLNEAFSHVDGLRHPWNYLSLLWYIRKKTKCLTMKSVLVLPEYWGSGIAFLMFDEMLTRATERGYQWVDGSLTSADNPRTPMLAERFGGKVYKCYRVYSKKIS